MQGLFSPPTGDFPKRFATAALTVAAFFLATTASAQPTPTPGAMGVLENPAPGAHVSGVGLISGWVCDADVVEVTIDGFLTQTTAYGTQRGDTQGACGDTDNGFGLLFNWNLLGDGNHTIAAFADGVEIGRATFDVTTLGLPFIRDLEATYRVEDFPEEGDSFGLQWEESAQNFLIVPPPAGGTLARPAAAGVATDVELESPAAAVLGVLENPSDGGRTSGIGLVSGWVCDADVVEIVIDGTTTIPAAYPTTRLDTAASCGGNSLTGFGALFNWNLLSNGEHTAVALADGMEFDRSTFRVRKLGGTFLRGLDRTLILEDFPVTGTDLEVEWVQGAQNFMISGIVGAIPTPTPGPTQTPRPTVPNTPTPTPGPTPGPTPPVPSGCPNGFMPDGGNGQPGVVPKDPLVQSGIRLQQGERRVYCANLQAPARRVRVEVAELCLGANVLLTVTPPPLTYSDGTPLDVQQSPRSANYGSLAKPPGYVPAGIFLVDVLGLEVGADCQQNGSRINLSWTYTQ